MHVQHFESIAVIVTCAITLPRYPDTKKQGTIQTLEKGGEHVLSDQEYEDIQIINIGAGDENEEARYEQDPSER